MRQASTLLWYRFHCFWHRTTSWRNYLLARNLVKIEAGVFKECHTSQLPTPILWLCDYAGSHRPMISGFASSRAWIHVLTISSSGRFIAAHRIHPESLRAR